MLDSRSTYLSQNGSSLLQRILAYLSPFVNNGYTGASGFRSIETTSCTEEAYLDIKIERKNRKDGGMSVSFTV